MRRHEGRRLRLHRFRHATYFRSDAQDKFLVGDFYGKRGVDPDNFPQRASDDGLEEIIERASRRVPKLENAEVMRGVTGVYDMTPDSRPLLGEVPGVDGLYLCAGFSGMGFKISPAIGLVMSELLLDGAARQWTSRRSVQDVLPKASRSRRSSSTKTTSVAPPSRRLSEGVSPSADEGRMPS